MIKTNYRAPPPPHLNRGGTFFSLRPMSMPTNLLTRAQLGELIFQQIKTDLKSRGYSMTNRNFPADYPISRRAVYLIKRGVFTVDTLNKLPGVKVEEWFRVG